MRKIIKTSVRIACVWFLMLLSACSTNATQPVSSTSAPSARQTEAIPPTNAAAPSTSNTIETTSADLPPQPRLGQMQISYPIVMLPGSSKTVNLSMYIPAELADASPESFKREVLPPDTPRPLGKYSEYNALILVSKRMQVELLAPKFTIEALYPPEQDIDLSPSVRTNWGWTVTAPDQPNEYVFVVKVYIANEKSPRWVGSFDVVVEAPTALPSPTSLLTLTPTPDSVTGSIMKNISDNAATLIGTILTTLVAVIGLYLQYRKPKGKDTKK